MVSLLADPDFSPIQAALTSILSGKSSPTLGEAALVPVFRKTKRKRSCSIGRFRRRYHAMPEENSGGIHFDTHNRGSVTLYFHNPMTDGNFQRDFIHICDKDTSHMRHPVHAGGVLGVYTCFSLTTIRRFRFLRARMRPARRCFPGKYRFVRRGNRESDPSDNCR